MQSAILGTSLLRVSRLAYGAWRLTEATGRAALLAAYEAGYTLFDHANIYGGGDGERVHGALLHASPGLRERTVLVTKCGVRKPDDPTGAPYRYELSHDYILSCCEESLRRLQVETVDLYLLHRADWLANPAEIAEAFTKLKESGKVRFFGVSNFRPTLVTAIQAACPMPIIVNQIEISLGRLDAFEDGTLDQCLIERITPLAWSPLGGGQYAEGAQRILPGQQGYRTEGVLPLLDQYAAQRAVTRSAIALAWLMKHPAGIIPIVGSTNPRRIRDAARADEVQLDRNEWYHLLQAAMGGRLP
jgi:predicted oxidoreductase